MSPLKRTDTILVPASSRELVGRGAPRNAVYGATPKAAVVVWDRMSLRQMNLVEEALADRDFSALSVEEQDRALAALERVAEALNSDPDIWE